MIMLFTGWSDSIVGVFRYLDRSVRNPLSCSESTARGTRTVASSVNQQESISNLSGLVMRGSVFTRLAGISGAAAIALGAYGAHSLGPKAKTTEEQKKAFEVANRYHLIHSVALLGVPLAAHPKLTGVLMVAGCLLFSGTCYYHT